MQLNVADNEVLYSGYNYKITSLPFFSFKIRNGYHADHLTHHDHRDDTDTV